MNAGRILCSILLGMYTIYIIRNNTITIAGANTKRSLLLTMIQLGQLLMLELMVIFGGRILHSFSIFSLILAVLLWGEMFALKQNLNEYFMCKEGKSYGISIIAVSYTHLAWLRFSKIRRMQDLSLEWHMLCMKI